MTDELSILGIGRIDVNNPAFRRVQEKTGVSLSNDQRKAAIAFMKDVARPVTQNLLTREQAIFWAKKETILTTEEIKTLVEGGYELRDTTHYLLTNTAQTSIVNLMPASTNYAIGVCSFEKRAVQNPFMFTHIAIGYGENASPKVNAATVKYQYDRDVPAEFQNAVLKIEQGQREIFSLPLQRLFQRDAGNGTLNDHLLKLNAPKFLKTGAPVTFNLIFPDGVTVTPITADAKSFINVSLVGAELSPVGK